MAAHPAETSPLGVDMLPAIKKRTITHQKSGSFPPPELPASPVIRPCPTPARSTAKSDVGAATSDPDGSPPITRVTLPSCRAHYPGGPDRCLCRLLPCPRGLPRPMVGSASTLFLSRSHEAADNDR